jgi:hypothetical protein
MELQVLELLPFGYGDEFPAHLTWKGGVDKQILDVLRLRISEREGLVEGSDKGLSLGLSLGARLTVGWVVRCWEGESVGLSWIVPVWDDIHN